MYGGHSDFSLGRLLSVAKNTRPDAIIMGSHHYVQLSEFDIQKEFLEPGDFNSVKFVAASGAAVSGSCKEKLQKIFRHSVAYVDGYGQSENGIVSAGLQEFEGLGILTPGCRVKVSTFELQIEDMAQKN